MSYVITAIISILIGLLIAYLNFKYFRKRVRSFQGRLDNFKTITEFNKFLFDNSERIFFIDISLTFENMQKSNNEKAFLLMLNEQEDIHMGSLVVRFNSRDDENMLVDSRPTSHRIKGYFKIIHSSGPQQGIFTVILKPVPLESIYSNT